MTSIVGLSGALVQRLPWNKNGMSNWLCTRTGRGVNVYNITKCRCSCLVLQSKYIKRRTLKLVIKVIVFVLFFAFFWNITKLDDGF